MTSSRILLALSILVLGCACVISQTRIDRNVLASGATRASSSTHGITGTIGQPIIGTAKNTTHVGSFGFWYNHTNVAVNVERIHSAPPSTASLDQNYPNPVYSSAIIRFSLPTAQYARLYLNDELGRTVRQLAEGLFEAGSYQTGFLPTDLPAGTYFYRLQAGSQLLSRRLTILR